MTSIQGWIGSVESNARQPRLLGAGKLHFQREHCLHHNGGWHSCTRAVQRLDSDRTRMPYAYRRWDFRAPRQRGVTMGNSENRHSGFGSREREGGPSLRELGGVGARVRWDRSKSAGSNRRFGRTRGFRHAGSLVPLYSSSDDAWIGRNLGSLGHTPSRVVAKSAAA